MSLRVYAKTFKHPKTPNLASTRSTVIPDHGQTLRANISTNHGHEFGIRDQESYIKWEGTRGAIKARMGLLMNYPSAEPDEFEYCVAKDGGGWAWNEVTLEGSWSPDAFAGTMSSLMRLLEESSDKLPASVADGFGQGSYHSSETGATPIPSV